MVEKVSALHELVRRLRSEKETEADGLIQEFLDTHEFPLREGRTAVFVFHGEADRVRLQHWVFGLDTKVDLEPLEGTDLWFVALDLPEETRMEYKLAVERDGEEEWIVDPLNPRSARDPFGANSVYQGPGYTTPSWTRIDPENPPRSGELHELQVRSQALGGRRDVFVYVPARLRYTRRYPLLIVHDGMDYLRYGDLLPVLDNLIERHEIAPLVVALTQSPKRLKEYGADPRHNRFIAEELVPRLEKEFPLEPDPTHRGVMGASFGAVASLSTAWRYPDRFGRLLLQSGSFAFSDLGPHRRSEAFDEVAAFMNVFRAEPGRPAEKIYLSCGIHESLIYENRSLVPVLQEAGLDVKYREARDGHNWQNWRDRLREGLSWLFPGPLWMVYE